MAGPDGQIDIYKKIRNRGILTYRWLKLLFNVNVWTLIIKQLVDLKISYILGLAFLISKIFSKSIVLGLKIFCFKQMIAYSNGLTQLSRLISSRNPLE